MTVVGTYVAASEIHPSPLDARHGLPTPPADFVGRQTELDELVNAVGIGGVHVLALQGPGGVGKTAAALKVAHRLKDNFPNAQIYLDLRGVSEKPLSSTEAMAYVIHAFHAEANIPDSEARVRALYLSVLHDKRALLLMDNARDATQVAPLIPPESCALLVTSRSCFTLPGLHEKRLDVLPLPIAEALLVEICPRIDGHAGIIAGLCGRLPLALRLAASLLKQRIDLGPADYVRRLKERRLAALPAAGEDPSMEASINLSYSLLSPETQKRWRTLGVFPDTFDAPAATALWQMEADAAEDVLGDLLKYSMLEWNDTARRCRLHDLMRDFARARLQEVGEEDEGARRHARHYADVLTQANDLYMKGGDSIKPGLALFDLEWGNVQAGQAWAAAHAERDNEAALLCSRYPNVGTYCLQLRLHPRESIRWREAALAAARRLKDKRSAACHTGNLGIAHHRLGEYHRAIDCHQQHLAIAREIDDAQGQSTALGNLGIEYGSLGDHRGAIVQHEQALVIDRIIGDRRGEGASLGNLGLAYFSLGDSPKAIRYFREHLAITRSIGDRQGEGQALGNLGDAHHKLREYRLAAMYHMQALDIAREMRDRKGEADALSSIGLDYAALGEHSSATKCHEEQLAIALEIGDRQGEGVALGNLGSVYYSLGEYRRAIDYFEQQLAISRKIGDRQGEANARWNISLALARLDKPVEAIEYAEAALEIYEQIEDPDTTMVRRQLEEWKGSGDRAVG